MAPNTIERVGGSTVSPETMQASDVIRVFLVDDHELIRQGLRDFVDAEVDLEVVGEAGTAREALARIPAMRPRVLVLDIQLPDGNGVEICREIRSTQPEIRVLFLTAFSDRQTVVQALMAGAAGFVMKKTKPSELVNAIRRVAGGESMVDPSVAGLVLEQLRSGSSHGPTQLSRQEHRVLELIGRGMTNRQISREMHLVEKTVKNYVSNLLRKLGMQHRTQAAIYAVKSEGPAGPR
jgi:DNA-binding NarL/FixJ family response regulator